MARQRFFITTAGDADARLTARLLMAIDHEFPGATVREAPCDLVGGIRLDVDVNDD